MSGKGLDANRESPSSSETSIAFSKNSLSFLYLSNYLPLYLCIHACRARSVNS